MARLTIDALVSFSNVPLHLALALGFAVSAGAILVGVALIVMKLVGVYSVPGWTPLAVGLSFLGGMQVLMMGMMGLYVARIHAEVKGRPLYLVRELQGFASASHPSGAAAPLEVDRHGHAP